MTQKNLNIAINGFGRIGRCIARHACECDEPVKLVGINSPSSAEDMAHLMQFDSVHGRAPCKVVPSGESLVIKKAGPAGDAPEWSVPLTHTKIPADVEPNGAHALMECTGKFKDMASCSAFLDETLRTGDAKTGGAKTGGLQNVEAKTGDAKTGGAQNSGAKSVLISSPAKSDVRMVIYGINHETLTEEDKVISVGSCTTNCLAPVVCALHDALVIESAFVTTVHSYTGDQNIVDASHKSDMRRARAAGVSMVPTSTGAARSIGVIMPELAGKIDGAAVRVPTPNVSMIDLTAVVTKSTNINEVNNILREFCLKSDVHSSVMHYEERPLVSSDFNHTSHSAIVDASETRVTCGTLVRVVAWYDNEWAFARRMIDIALYMRLAGLT